MIQVVFEKEQNRAVAMDGSRIAGECVFTEDAGTWNIVHTGVESEYGGQGLAGRLVDCVASAAKEAGVKLTADCSYAKKRLGLDGGQENAFLKLAEDRFSCRKFSDRPVEDEKIEAILKAGIVSPTAHNMQPEKIWVLRSEEALAKARECTQCHFGAPLIFAVGYKNEDGWVRPSDGRPFADVDASIVGTQMMLEIHDLGLRTTWVGFFDAPKLHEKFPEMDGYEMIALFPTGYAAENAHPSHMHNDRKDKSELVEFL
jgi:nitroreductase